MGLRDRAKAASKAAMEAGSKGAQLARGELEKRGVDVGALSTAVTDGLGVANRRGELKRWRIAKAALRPTKTGKNLAVNVAREAMRQRRSISAAQPLRQDAVATVDVALDDTFYGDLLDWVIADAGVVDDDANRTQLVVFFAQAGVDRVAEEILSPPAFLAYCAEVDELPLDLRTRAEALLARSPTVRPRLLERLDELRQSAVDLGRRDSRLQLVSSACCAGITSASPEGGLRCGSCGERC